jgi:two-component system, NarL family, nitrate/nitrite response regulator NarL
VLSSDTLLRAGLVSLLNHAEGLFVVGSGSSLESVRKLLEDRITEVLLADLDSISPSDRSAVETMAKSGKVNAVLLSNQGTDVEDVEGHIVTIHRNTDPAGLFDALQEAAGRGNGQMAQVRETGLGYGYRDALTPRELEVAQLVAKGLSNRRIALILGLQEQSIKNLVSTVMRKLHCENRVQVALRLTGRSTA